MPKRIRCKKCKRYLKGDDYEYYESTGERYCNPCYLNKLNKIGEELDAVAQDLDETLKRYS